MTARNRLISVLAAMSLAGSASLATTASAVDCPIAHIGKDYSKPDLPPYRACPFAAGTTTKAELKKALRGMTRAQVVAYLGPPDVLETSQDGAQGYDYYSPSWGTGGNTGPRVTDPLTGLVAKLVIVWFTDNDNWTVFDVGAYSL
jgi:outer membrane protein assembly factor BamE (lipoprotein component of BamABCDE complex)